MLKHLFKLIWNKKTKLLLMSEMLVFVPGIWFWYSALMVFYYTNYKKPIGLDDEKKTYGLVNYNNSNPQKKNTDSLNLYYETLRQGDESYAPQVVNFAVTYLFRKRTNGRAMHYKNAKPHRLLYCRW